MTLNRNPIELYLGLLKKTLSYTLWDEPGVPIETFNYARTGVKRTAVDFLSKLLRRLDICTSSEEEYFTERSGRRASLSDGGRNHDWFAQIG